LDDPWELGAAYERFMGRWSGPVAAEFLAWLALPPNGRWLDVGCGTGALSALIGQTAVPQSLTGVDFSTGFINFARQRLTEEIYDFRVGSALDLPVENGVFDTAVSGLAFNFFPEPEKALAEMVRAVKPGGTVALYVWNYSGGMEMLRCFWDAATTLDKQAAELDEGGRFSICRPEALRTLFNLGGLSDVHLKGLETAAVFREFDDYWQPFLDRNGPAPAYVASLTPTQQDNLSDHLRRQLPTNPDGSIQLTNKAWAVCGVK
jgi:SAM-dependent methyltransferase